MNSLEAMMKGMANAGKELMVFDWDRAAELIRDRQPERASAGLQSDWEWTGGPIYRDGEPVPADETYTYLASTWAKPELDLDGEIIECWKYQSETPGWDSKTYWPPSSLSILAGEEPVGPLEGGPQEWDE